MWFALIFLLHQEFELMLNFLNKIEQICTKRIKKKRNVSNKIYERLFNLKQKKNKTNVA